MTNHHYYDELYISTTLKLVFAAIVSALIALYSYNVGRLDSTAFIFFQLSLNVIAAISASYVTCLFLDNWGLGPLITYSKQQKALVIFLAVIPILAYATFCYGIEV